MLLLCLFGAFQLPQQRHQVEKSIPTTAMAKHPLEYKNGAHLDDVGEHQAVQHNRHCNVHVLGLANKPQGMRGPIAQTRKRICPERQLSHELKKGMEGTDI